MAEREPRPESRETRNESRVSIRRLLIANRGEIALRIIRACKELRIETVAVYSEADAGSPHVLAADRAIAIGPAPAVESYLAIGTIIDAARQSGADAIHPGYGFLAENAAFAAACRDARLVFVGPPPGVIEQMGSKIESRRVMERAGVPVVPVVTPDDQSETAIVEAASRLGLPVLIKASAGGGGKGMRAVHSRDELAEAIAGARREAEAAFGDGTLYLERLVDRARHVEIQVFGDAHGHVVHLFERDCSVQRRHQKVIEESPSPALTASLRRTMGEAAVRAASAVGYQNAGTIEFLLEGSGDRAHFYFLEMNTRLQVEHPVTEAVTGVDMVRAQLLVAGGGPLPWQQQDLSQRGHAIECRLYAEDPSTGFLPQAGTIRLYREPTFPGVRIDSGVTEGNEVTVHYDPLLAKVIASGVSREITIERLSAALRAFPILGIRTNIALLLRILALPRFRAGEIDTGFLDAEIDQLIAEDQAVPPDAVLAAAAAYEQAPAVPGGVAVTVVPDPWVTLAGWRS